MIDRTNCILSVLPALTILVLLNACGVKQHLHDPKSLPGNSSSGGSDGVGMSGAGGRVQPAQPGPSGTGGATSAPSSGGVSGGSSPQGGSSGAGGAGDAGDPNNRTDTRVPAMQVDTATPSMPGPTIAGMQVAKEKAIVFLHVGHSDMAGRADGPASLRAFVTDTDPHLWVYSQGGKFRPASEPTAGDAQSAGKGGPGMAILRTALTHAPDAFIISVGHGHSGSTGGYCPNFRKSGPFYALFMDAARELKGKVIFAGLFTMFGITEYHLGTPGLTGVAACLTGLVNEVRADLGDPQIPLLVGDWNMGGTGIYAPDSEYGRVVRPQIQMVPMRDPLSAVIPTDGLQMQDDRHLNFQGQKAWAERAFGIMAQKGWLTWGKR
jgi:hypothetical protein